MMRAKMQVSGVEKHGEPVTAMSLRMQAVTEKPFDEGGNSEDNTFSKWTPSASLSMSITNPDLFDKFTIGQKFYLDFTEVVAEAAPEVADEPVAEPGAEAAPEA